MPQAPVVQPNSPAALFTMPETEEQKVETIINPCVEFSQAPVVDMMQSVSQLPVCGDKIVDEKEPIITVVQPLVPQSKVSTGLALPKTPAQIYTDQVCQEKDQAMQAYLMNLFDFGFTNFEINKEVLLKAKMNFEAAISMLVD